MTSRRPLKTLCTLDVTYDWRAAYDWTTIGVLSCSTARTVLDPVCSNQGVMRVTKLPAVVHQVTTNNYALILIKELQRRKVGKMID